MRASKHCHPTNQYSLVVVLDKSTWTELENVSGIMNGKIEAWVKSDGIPLVLFDTNKNVMAFAIYDPATNLLCNFYAKDSEVIKIFLKLAHDYTQSISTSKDASMVRLDYGYQMRTVST